MIAIWPQPPVLRLADDKPEGCVNGVIRIRPHERSLNEVLEEHKRRAKQRKKRRIVLQREIQIAKRQMREYDHLLAELKQLSNDEAADLEEAVRLRKLAEEHAKWSSSVRTQI